MAIPLKYNLRNIRVRWRATVATILGIALVVAVYLLMQTMAAGLEKSSQNTGDPRNIMVVRKGSTAESSSQIYREQYSSILIRAADEAATQSLTNRIASDKRLPLLALKEVDYYGSQTKTAGPIKFLGKFLAVAMSIGAIFAAMNTMYASVGART